MHRYRFSALLLAGLVAGCATASSHRPVEVLDERTGVTFASLKQPIELVPNAEGAILGKRSSFAYLGPVEWDRMGGISYSLWVHIAPGTDHQAVDVHSAAAVSLVLDDGSLTLSPVEIPKLGHDPYQAAVPWGQTVYFDLNVGMLKKMASSQKFELDVRATDDSTLRFFPTYPARATLLEYMHSRGITDD